MTLMLDSQVSDVRDLARKAGIKPTITRLGTGHPLLEQIAPGERRFVAASAMPERAANDEARRGGRNGGSGRNAGRGRGRGRGRGNGSAASTPAGGNRNRGGRGRSGAATSQASGGRPHSAASFSSNRRSR